MKRNTPEDCIALAHKGIIEFLIKEVDEGNGNLIDGDSVVLALCIGREKLKHYPRNVEYEKMAKSVTHYFPNLKTTSKASPFFLYYFYRLSGLI